MKSSDLSKIIREAITSELKEMIKEAVDYAVAREFRLLREELAKPAKEVVRQPEKKSTLKKSFAEMMLEDEPKKEQEVLTENKEPIFKKGPFANILNNTRPFTKADEAGAGGFQQQVPLLDRGALRAKILGGDTIKATTADMVSIPLQDPDGKPINPQVLKTEEGQKVLQNLTKDYSSFLKKVDQKVKQRRG